MLPWLKGRVGQCGAGCGQGPIRLKAVGWVFFKLFFFKVIIRSIFSESPISFCT